MSVVFEGHNHAGDRTDKHNVEKGRGVSGWDWEEHQHAYKESNSACLFAHGADAFVRAYLDKWVTHELDTTKKGGTVEEDWDGELVLVSLMNQPTPLPLPLPLSLFLPVGAINSGQAPTSVYGPGSPHLVWAGRRAGPTDRRGASGHRSAKAQ